MTFPFTFFHQNLVSVDWLYVRLFATPWTVALPGSSVHGILQARIPEWIAISFSRDLPAPGIEARSSTLQADSILSELSGKPEI